MEGYDEIRSAIDAKLTSASLEHALYEEGGQRNLVMTVSPSDINKAKSIMK